MMLHSLKLCQIALSLLMAAVLVQATPAQQPAEPLPGPPASEAASPPSPPTPAPEVPATPIPPPPSLPPAADPNAPDENALAAAIQALPPPPRDQVLDYGALFPVETRLELSERLLKLKNGQNLPLYVYVLPVKPELSLKEMVITVHAVEEAWLKTSPLAAAVVVIPGDKAQLFCHIGGRDSGEFPRKLLVEKSYQAAQAAKIPAVPIPDQVLMAAQKLLEELASLKSATVAPDALLIKKAAPRNLARWWAHTREDVVDAFTSPYFYTGLGAVVLAMLLWSLARWLNRSRRHYFPKVKPRLRFDGLYSGGNNAMTAFVGKRNTERTKGGEAEEEKLSLPDDDV